MTYLRVSTGDQARSGLGIEAQRAALAAAAAVADWHLVDERVDQGVSGRIEWSERPALAAAVQLVDGGIADAIAVARLDRLARRTEDALQLARQLGARLICLDPEIDTTTASGLFGFTVFAAVAEFEGTVASERTSAAMLAKLARGERVGRPRSCPDEVLDQVLELRAAGGTLVTIAAAMNAAGVLTPAGSPRWWPSHVSRLLRTQDARARAGVAECGSIWGGRKDGGTSGQRAAHGGVREPLPR